MRNAFIIGGVAVVAIVIGVLVFLYGDGINRPIGAYEIPLSAVVVPFTELMRGTQSNVSTRTNYLITSTNELEKLWKMINAGGKMPTVDFSQNYIAAVFAGQKMTGGYAISVTKVIDAQGRMVTVTLTSPGSACIVTQSTTAPYQIIELSKTSLPFTHEDQTTMTSCSQ